jgi:hypothetical protein
MALLTVASYFTDWDIPLPKRTTGRYTVGLLTSVIQIHSHTCRGRYLGFKSEDLNSNGIGIEKVELFVINYSSKKYMKENTSLNLIILFFYQ